MRTGIICNNGEEARIIIKLLYNNGFKWLSDAFKSNCLNKDVNECINETYWNSYAETNMYIVNDKDMSISYFSKVDKDVELILNAPDFINLIEE